jgi:diguanylate cyclase (GGDEF)-like protein/PAS domain S-box-containing protein
VIHAPRARRGPDGQLELTGSDVIDEQPSDAETRRADVLARLDTPGTVALSFDLDGMIVPWPASLPVHGPGVSARSLMDLVADAHRAEIVRAWRDLHRTGASQLTLRLVNEPDRLLHCAVRNLMATDGAVVAVLWADDGAEIPLGDARPLPARFGVIRQTPVGDVQHVDAGYQSMLGWTFEEATTTPSIDYVHPDDHGLALGAWMDMIQSGRSHPRRWRTLRRDGRYLWTEVVFIRAIDDDATETIITELTDVTDEVATRERLEAQEVLLNHMAQVVPVGLFHVGFDSTVAYANDRLHDILGTVPSDSLPAQLATVVAADRQEVAAAIGRVCATGVDEDVEGEVHPPGDGEPRRCVFAVRPLRDRLGVVTGAIVCVSDITELSRRLVGLERDLIHRSFHDDLTGLPNRTLLINGMEDAIVDSRESGTEVAVLLVDLDGFKAVNDSLGHTLGDELLRAASDRIRAVARPNDLVARVGGDEFAVLMDDFIDPDLPRRTAEQVLASCSQPYEIDGHLLQTGVSIGIATSATAPGTEELLRDADLAMYRAKAAGRGRYETFEPAMHAAAVARVELEASLRTGIEEGQLVLLYQPIHDLVTGEVSSAEALVRWRHPLHGMVSPADFIPLAEETGLIVPLGRFVLDEACAEAARWVERMGAEAPRVSVNLSGRQMASPTVLDDVLGALHRSGLDPFRLQLEITESVLVERSEQNAIVLATLRNTGLTIAIDDFGTGYSSLAYLERLPVDIIKIDKAFVDRIESGGRHAKLIKGILSLTEDLGLTAVAEGIESAEQLRALEELRCPSGQGFLFSRPIDAEALGVYLATHQNRGERSPDLRSVS